MQFPLVFSFGSFSLPAHFIFEFLAYALGMRIYLRTRRKTRLNLEQTLWILAGAICGAALGSKVLYWFEDPVTLIQRNTLECWLQGKTIVGGLLGGLIGVEGVKRHIGYTDSTGDDLVFPILCGMMLGRIGCFSSGLADHTHGIETTLGWGVNFGDGIYRHPTQLYEILFLLGLLCFLKLRKKWPFEDGQIFQFFMISYLAYRFLSEFIKPGVKFYYGFNAIQLACIAGLIYYRKSILLLFSRK